MQNNLLIILAIFFIIICITSGMIINIKGEKQEILNQNKEYEKYINKNIYGTDLATLIGKAINENNKNNIPKDENGYYIENEQNSIKIYLNMKTVENTYTMEEIYKGEIINFVKNFNIIQFRCTNITYHKKTGKIAKLIFQEL